MSEPSPSLERTDQSCRVLKFGGTSVGTPEGAHRAAHIVGRAAEDCRPVVVVSAAAGVTDLLVHAADAAPHSPTEAAAQSERVRARYRTLAEETIDDEGLRTRYASTLRARVSALTRALTAPLPSGSAARDAVLAEGERLMVPLLVGTFAAAGHRSRAVDAAALIRTDAAHGGATVDWPSTRAQIQQWRAQWGAACIPVVTGFIGSTGDGATTTLGRGGSDYSAALLARGLAADRLERWTDVDGLYSQDPAENEEAQRLSQIRMAKARAWAQEGRLGLHPRTLDPLATAGIPLHVRCTHQPDAPGTRVVPTPSATHC